MRRYKQFAVAVEWTRDNGLHMSETTVQAHSAKPWYLIDR